MSPEGDLALLIILLLLMGSFFFTGSEAGFLAVSATRVRQLRDAGSRLALFLGFLIRHRSLALATIITCINVCNYTAERLAVGYAMSINEQWGPLLGAAVAFLIVLAFCEVLPIQYGARTAERTALRGAAPIAFLAVVLWPVVALVAGVSRLVLRVFGIHARTILPSVTEAHIRAMIEQGEETGAIAPTERRMLRGVLEFGDYTVAQIMTPRPDMVCVEQEQTLQEALDLGLESRHSRIPAYSATPDNVTGVLHLKDLLPYALRGELDKPVKEVARSAYHVPESLRADTLLQQLQRRRTLMAIVKDEFGGTAGIVTVEDLLEEIVGDIRDEYDDREEPEIVQVGDAEFVCNARVSLHELQSHLAHIELPTEDYESLGGLLMGITGRIPADGERVSYGSLTLVVEQMNGRRIERIRAIEGPVDDDE